MSNKAGTLFVVATPIGNLGDITRRAVDVLKRVDVILAEDTRHSAPMLAQYGVEKPLISFHEHNEQRRIPAVLARLEQGDAVALISDAGTPLISDPGYGLVRAAREAGFRVVPIPGASAVMCALSAAGLATDRFVFEGFLPARRPARRRRLGELLDEPRTIVLLESPHRMLATLEDLAAVFPPDRRGTVARELTKIYETIRTSTIAELYAWMRHEADQRKGEFVLLVAGSARERPSDADGGHARVLATLLEELPLAQAVNIAARLTGQQKNRLYRLALEMKASSR